MSGHETTKRNNNICMTYVERKTIKRGEKPKKKKTKEKKKKKKERQKQKLKILHSLPVDKKAERGFVEAKVQRGDAIDMKIAKD